VRTLSTFGGILGSLWKVIGGGFGVVEGADVFGESEGENERWPSLLWWDGGDGCDGGDGGGSSVGDGGGGDFVLSSVVRS
jgi:hypothetical protein